MSKIQWDKPDEDGQTISKCGRWMIEGNDPVGRKTVSYTSYNVHYCGFVYIRNVWQMRSAKAAVQIANASQSIKAPNGNIIPNRDWDYRSI